MKLLFQWIISAIAIGIAAYLVPGVVVTPLGALLLAVVLGALNLFIRPILVVLTLPITIVTLGLFTLVINAALVLVAAWLVPGFAVAGFWSALGFAVMLMIVGWVFDMWRHD